MNILVCDGIAQAAVERLREAGHEVSEKSGLAGADLIAALARVQALLVRGATKVTGEVLRAAPDLRFVARAGTGIDNIDAVVAKELGITIFNAPAANAVAVAELTLGLMLSFERHIAPAATDMRHGRWEKKRYMGREIAGKRLGLVGFGRIAREVARRARAFGMDVCASDPLLDSWPTGFEWVQPMALNDLLPTVDYLSLHVPMTAGTRGMIGAHELAAMRETAVVVNCARGGVLDEAALDEALKAGTLRGAALDVYATEPPGASSLLERPNVIATPHLGASTEEAQARAGVEVAEQVIEALSGLKV